MTTYYDPYSSQMTALQQQIANMKATPHGSTTPNGQVPWQTQLGNLQQALNSMTGQQQQSQSPPQLGTPDSMPSVSKIPSTFGSTEFTLPEFTSPTIDPYSGLPGGHLNSPAINPFSGMLGSSQSFAPIQGAQSGGGGVGTYNSGITAGELPQSAIDSASSTLRESIAPPAGIRGALAQQFGDYTRGQQASDNTDLVRSGAAQQAKMNLTRQTAQANAGLNWSDLLARLNEAAMRQRNAVAQPLIGQVLSALV